MAKLPPPNITPSEFFEKWLPEQFEIVKTELGADKWVAVPEISLACTLTGEGGGTWRLAINGGILSVSQGAGDGALVELTTAVNDWRALVTPVSQGGLLPDPEAASAPPNLPMLNPAALTQLTMIAGTLSIQIAGFQGRDWQLGATVKGAAEPNASIVVDAATLEEIRTGAIAAPQAFFAGKIQISGDVSFAMQLGMAFMTPAS